VGALLALVSPQQTAFFLTTTTTTHIPTWEKARLSDCPSPLPAFPECRHNNHGRIDDVM